jgi:hypothetical protein
MPQLLSGAFILSRPVSRIPLGYFYLKLYRVPQRSEVNIVVTRSKYRGLIGEVAIVRIVQGVLNEVSDEHLHAFWWYIATFEVIRCYNVVVGMIVREIFEGDIRVIVELVE